ncbi:Gfo/Idh/MocA family oxidoreductase [Oceanobacillus jeddahense]|uniref:Gfo/Idh/MocA family oxidoreductase n=1 Tax=Oceanobacillus jeddahense TaxID=1462527 RepID=UPI0005958B67|nr:Gfo/Idh/MocA family oxidoreductase [Oceanobacillus jeddahense]
MDSKIGVCVIGAGRAGLLHANNYRRNVPNAKLVAVVDPNEENVKHAVKELEIDKYYLNYQDALHDDEIDAVVIVTPTNYHKEIAVAAANAGKHIFCEKPMAINEDECDYMIEAAQKNNVKLQIGFMRRFDQSFNLAKEAIENGEIGDIVLVKSLTRGPSVPQEWMYDVERSNGPLAEVNSHDIDTLRWLTGGEFKSVYAIANNYRCQDISEKYPDFYDNVVLVSEFDNGKQGVIDGSVSVKYGYDARVEILGTEGVIFVGETYDKQISVCNVETGSKRPLTKTWRSLFKEAYLEEDIDFVNCIIEDSEPSVNGHDGKMAVKVVNAGNKSIKTGDKVILD